MSSFLPDYLQIPSVLIEDKDMQQLDWLVYAVIYWQSKLKLQKCIASNQTIADLLHSSAGSVANSISRLNKKKYIHVVKDEKTNTRQELVPLVYYRASSIDEPPLHLQMNPPSSTDEHNKNIEKEYILDPLTGKTSATKSNYGTSHSKHPKTTDSNQDLQPLPYSKLWEFAIKYGVSLKDVQETHQQVLDAIADGNKYKTKSVSRTLANWIRMGLSRRSLQPLDEVGKMLLESESPEKIEERERIFGLLHEKGEI